MSVIVVVNAFQVLPVYFPRKLLSPLNSFELAAFWRSGRPYPALRGAFSDSRGTHRCASLRRSREPAISAARLLDLWSAIFGYQWHPLKHSLSAVTKQITVSPVLDATRIPPWLLFGLSELTL